MAALSKVFQGKEGKRNLLGLVLLSAGLVAGWLILGKWGIDGDGMGVQGRLIVLGFALVVLAYRFWDALDSE